MRNDAQSVSKTFIESIAGFTAGIASTLVRISTSRLLMCASHLIESQIAHPLDIVKTRLQRMLLDPGYELSLTDFTSRERNVGARWDILAYCSGYLPEWGHSGGILSWSGTQSCRQFCQLGTVFCLLRSDQKWHELLASIWGAPFLLWLFYRLWSCR